ncbi:MAG: hypothetical protein ACFE9L_08720 [Candidatus Hodarchaeota archaeon]
MALNLSIDDFKSIGRLVCVSTTFASFQYLVLTFIAAFLYPGGYDYFQYNFSALGRVNAINGEPNPVSSFLFLVACMITGILLIPFWIIIYSLFRKTLIEKILALIGSVSGILSAPLLIGLAVYPSDTQSLGHGFFARYFFLAFAVAILLYSVVILFNREYPNIFSIVGLAIFILVVIYVFVPLYGLGPLTQKIIVYSYIIWAFIQLFRIWPSVEPEKRIFA